MPGLAVHDVFELARDHRGRGLAREHYANADGFYDRTPIRRVDLIAAGWSLDLAPVWLRPCLTEEQAAPARKIATDRGFSDIPAAEDLYAANLATADPRGIAALKELAAGEDHDLAMFLDLDNQAHRGFLGARGIL